MTEIAKRVAVIGGGAAGMMAAGTALKNGADVTIFEHTDRLGKKLAITGKGRCNVTNSCTLNEFIENVTRNHRFLYTALNAFSPYDTMTFFEELGVELKTERGNRVFPADDKAKTIVDAMRAYCRNAKIIFENVSEITLNSDETLTVHAKEQRSFDAVILACGGKSYPLTGSDGSGYKIAKALGHTVTDLIPSLVPFEASPKTCAALMGLSLKNVAIKITDKSGKEVYNDFGEMMFTHFGITGPMILSASACLRACNLTDFTLSIDLKPALDEKTLDKRLLSELEAGANKDLTNILRTLLPSKMINVFIERVEIDSHKKANLITKEERKRILTTLKAFNISLIRPRPIEEAIVTSGGIEVKEITPKTMESKIVKNLFFAGEIIDVDAYTGGFNLQIAFSTGYLAGLNASMI